MQTMPKHAKLFQVSPLLSTMQLSSPHIITGELIIITCINKVILPVPLDKGAW
ncbi:hypothetical protein Ocin01_09794 [Orchesella cincta]|uniref:Uncharacterized protein n=1 Tax=Orchesella cincta TaxID=48709 RepID=A0A1D2MV14_ORCCI|nr:hypothetical protein Ocin01_09794 [Orchesella cincta]